jgi:GNAT superfamily N-acetyltransferase
MGKDIIWNAEVRSQKAEVKMQKYRIALGFSLCGSEPSAACPDPSATKGVSPRDDTGLQTAMTIQLRKAVMADIPRLRLLIEASVRGLQTDDYSPAQIELALKTVYGVDSRLIADGTYFVAEAVEPGSSHPTIVGCGGWSKRKTLYGGDQFSGREDSLLDPARDAAKIRAFFVRPDWARRGIGGMILEACEKAAQEARFTRLEMGATLSGVPFYCAKGYSAVENQAAPLGDGQSLPIVKMAKEVATGTDRKEG